MNLAEHEFIVIGAGIAGLATAMALAQRRARVRVLEQAPALAEVGAGIQVGPNGVAVLEALGLRDAAETCASLPPAIELHHSVSERRVARIPLGRQCIARYGRPYWQFHRADLLALLGAGAREAGVSVETGARVADVETHGNRCRVTLECGTTLLAEGVIAADGLRSGVRGRLFQGETPRFTGHVAWRGLVDAARLPERFFPDGVNVYMGPRRHLVTYPLRHGTLRNFVAVEERDDWVIEGWTEADDPENLRAAFAGFGPRVKRLLEAVDETFLWGLFDHPPLPNWVNGTVALIGDACHPMLPFLAQGAGTGLEDAWVLAAELDVATDLGQGLRAYEARRKPRATRIQRASLRNGRIYHLGPGVGTLAHLGLSAASAVAPGSLLGRFDWLYGADVVSAQATL